MSLSEWLNNFFANWTTVVRTGAVFVAIAAVVLTAVKSRFAWGAMLTSLIVGGVLIWGVTMNGLGWFSSGIQGETSAAVLTSVVYALAA